MRDTFVMCLELCLVFVSPLIAALYLICNEEFSHMRVLALLGDL